MARTKKRKIKRKNPSRGGRKFRLLGMNPGTLTEGFKPSVLRKILPMGVGAIAQSMVISAISKKSATVAGSPWLKVFIGIGTAGLLGMAAGKISAQDRNEVFAGAMLATGIDVFSATGFDKAIDGYFTPPPPPLPAPVTGTPRQAALPAPADTGVRGFTDEQTVAYDGTQDMAMGEVQYV